MRITEKQLQILMMILSDSIKVDMNIFCVSYKCRVSLYEQIINQQSEIINEIKNNEACNE